MKNKTKTKKLDSSFQIQPQIVAQVVISDVKRISVIAFNKLRATDLGASFLSLHFIIKSTSWIDQSSWRLTSMTTNGSNVGISGTFLDTYDGAINNSILNGTWTISGTATSYNCTMKSSYTKTSTTITSVVTSSTCSGVTTGTTSVATYSISGNTMTTTYTSSNGVTINSVYTKE